jgi:hypothetical protein
VIKKLEHLSLLSDLSFEKKGIDDSRRISEAKFVEIKNRVNDFLNHIANQETLLLAESQRLEGMKYEYIRIAKLERLEESCTYGMPDKASGKISWPLINNRYQLL